MSNGHNASIAHEFAETINSFDVFVDIEHAERVYSGDLPTVASGIYAVIESDSIEDIIPQVSIQGGAPDADIGALISKYDETVTEKQRHPLGTIDALTADAIERSCRTLRHMGRNILGGIVLLGDTADGTKDDIKRTQLATFVSKALSSSLVHESESYFLRKDASDADRNYVRFIKEGDRAQHWASYLLMRTMPPNKRLHEYFGIRRRDVKKIQAMYK